MVNLNVKAHILVCGETSDEDAGYKLREWFRIAGIKPNEIQLASGQYHKIVNALPDLKVIVCLGDYPTSLFTKYAKADTVRGSVYEHESKWVIPTLHPTSVLSQATWERRCISDWKKIVRIAREGWVRPVRNHIIWPYLDDIRDWGRQIRSKDIISFDIETWGNEIKCVGLATNERESITIPTTLEAWLKIEGKRSRATQSLAYAWKYLKAILESPHDKLGQNRLFDMWWLAQPEYGIKVRNAWWDTMDMHHALVPNESHALHFLASIYTDEPYWKDEAKDADAIVRIAKQGMDRLYVYNGLDVTVTWEVFANLFDTLAEQNYLPFYFQHYADMVTPILGLMLTGALVDRTEMMKLRAHHLLEALRYRDLACLQAGRALFKFDTTILERDMIADYYVNGPGIPLGLNRDEWLAQFAAKTKTLKSGKVKPLYKSEDIDRKWEQLLDKNISDQELAKLLFDEWRCPRGAKTETGLDKTDNTALKSIKNIVEGRKRGDFIDYKANIIRVIDNTLKHRRHQKVSTFVDDTRLDDDDRIRCTYKFTTKTGRLASAANPRGTGTNLQNQDRAIRSIYIASPGRILLECDLSQAEGRIVRVLSGDPEAIRLARRLPTEGDEHTENAIAIFSAFYGRELSASDIKDTKGTEQDLRQIGKKVVHAGNYDQGKFGLSKTLLKEGFTMTPAECGRLIEAHRAANPYVNIYQSKVRKAILQHRKLETSWGRRINFEHFRIDETLYKFAYVYIPQSEIGDLTNQYGLKALHTYITSEQMESDIILQVHDSVVVDAIPGEVYSIISFLKASMESRRVYAKFFGHPIELSVPVEFKLGLKWGQGREYKEMPTEDEVNNYVKELLG